MKISKYFLFAAAALVMGTGCSEDDPETPTKPVVESIEVAPATATVPSKGGKVSTMVTSSGAWTLSDEENEFVVPSVMEGGDGDVVEFTVLANDQEQDRTFTYTFTCGKKQATFQITLLKKASQSSEELELTYSEGSNTLPAEGGRVKVLVTSSSEWTLEGSYDFVTPSATSGEDGAEVLFDVKPNETYDDKTADYLFKMGSKEVAFQIVVKAATPENIEITSSKEMRLAYTEEKRLAVTLNTNVDSRDLTAEIVSATDGWLTYTIARPTEGGGDNDVTAYFSMAKNGGETSREATVTIKGVKDGTATLKVVQLPQSKIEVDKAAWFLKPEAQSIAVAVTANVEYDVVLSEESDGWLTYDATASTAAELHFTAAELTEATPRVCVVALTEKNGPDNADAVTTTITITQKPKGLIETVADMRNARCYFEKLNNSDALDGITFGTIEALVNIQEARKDGTLSTILGVEGRTLLRLGDATVPWNQIQFVTPAGNVTNASLKLTELDRWYHIAVTWAPENGATVVRIYIDGEMKHEATMSRGNLVTAYFNKTYTIYENDNTRGFQIGYSYDANRYFPGYMSEVRVWKRALSAEEINSQNHFYQVDPASEELVGYWKLNGKAEGIKSYEIKDFSPSGNTMRAEHDVRKQGNYYYGDDGMNWAEASLP